MTLEELISKHIAALGGMQAINAVKISRTTSKVKTSGMEGVSVAMYSNPGKEYLEFTLGTVNIKTAYNGKTGWIVGTATPLRPLTPDELRGMKTEAFLDTGIYNIEERNRTKMAMRREPDPATHDYVVDIYPAGGDPAAVFFNPTTYMIDRIVTQSHDGTDTSDFSGYRKFDGQVIASRTHSINNKTHLEIQYSLEKYEANTKIPDSLFESPKIEQGIDKGYVFLTNARGSNKRRPPASATIHYDLDNGMIVFPAKINGKSVRMAFDSGASHTAIYDNDAEALGLKPVGKLKISGYGGSVDTRISSINSLEMGGAIRLNDVPAFAVTPPSFMQNNPHMPFAGLIGHDIIKSLVVRIDFQKQTLTFIDPAAFHATSSDGTAFETDNGRMQPTVNAKLDELPAGKYDLDTGDPWTLTLCHPYVADHSLMERYPIGASKTLPGGIAGTSDFRVVNVRRFSLANQDMQGVPTRLAIDAKGSPTDSDGLIGTGLLSQYRITFDYPHNRIYLAPVTKQSIKPVQAQASNKARAPIGIVPFHYDPIIAPFITIDIRINNGPPMPFVVDTGSNKSMIMGNWAATKLGLVHLTGSPKQQNGAPQIVQVQASSKSVFKNFQIAGLSPNHPAFEKIKSYSLYSDLASLGYDRINGGRQIAGTVGFDLFNSQYQYEFDFASKVIRIYSCAHPGVMPADQGITTMQIIPGPYSTSFFAGPSGNHHAFYAMDIDLGHPASSISGLAAMHAPAASAAKVAATFDNYTDFQDTLSMPDILQGNKDAPNIPLRESYDDRSYLGLDVLSHYTITLDLSNNRFFLKPSQNRNSSVIGKRDIGVSPEGGRYQVSWVSEDSPAHAAGLLTGDELVTVDGVKTAAMPPAVVERALEGFAGASAKLTIRRHGQVSAVTFVRRSRFISKYNPTAGAEFRWTSSSLLVSRITPGSYAAKTGLQVDDNVVQLNGIKASKLEPGRISEELNRSKVSLTIRRPGQTDTIQFNLTAAI